MKAHEGERIEAVLVHIKVGEKCNINESEDVVVCFFFFNDTANTEVYTEEIVGSVRGV